MTNLKSILEPKLAELILEKCKITKKRSPFWFFTKEARRKSDVKLNVNKVSNLWHRLDPESKRVYFTMSELDKVRYKDERSSWVAEIGSLLSENRIDELSEVVPNIKTEKEILALLDTYVKNYGKMIQARSTNKLYKDIIDKTDSLDLNLTAEELISAIPEDFRPVLSKPRRPPCPFALYTWRQRDALMEKRKKENSTSPFLRFAAREWSNIDEKERDFYQKKYDKLLVEYEEAKRIYSERNRDATYLEDAGKQRRAFRKSIRKRLRDNGVLPINIRNAFNFFVMENKDVPLTDLTKIWRSLPEEEKDKYKKMSAEDSRRYYKELNSDLIKSVMILLNNRVKNKS